MRTAVGDARRLAGSAGRTSLLGAAVLVCSVFVAAPRLHGAGGDLPGAEARRRFLDAGRAYDEGRVPDAVRLYEDLIRGGRAPMEAYFNLGNAHVKGGRIGPAVLNYRKAWRLAPRDPDVGANLRLALRAAGAAEPDLSGTEIVLTSVSEREWDVVAAASWWATCLLLALALLLRGRGGLPVRFAAATGAVAAAALLGLWTWRGFDRNPELVVLRETENALRSPLASASPSFPLPEGSVVRARDFQGEWVRVTHGQLAGWVRRAACSPVLLEAPPR